MKKRRLGARGPEVSAIGLGCMGFTPPRQNPMPRETAVATIRQAGEMGETILDIERAHVLIERHSAGTPDTDNLWGSAKRLLDCLTTPVLLNVRKEGAHQRTKNKRGLSFIVDDAPKLDVQVVRRSLIRYSVRSSDKLFSV